MAERGDGLRLPEETRAELGILGKVGRKHLDRHRPIQAGIGRAVHLAHAAGSQGAANLVRAEPAAGGEAHRDSDYRWFCRLVLPNGSGGSRSPGRAARQGACYLAPLNHVVLRNVRLMRYPPISG